jgi:hypothetical protein
LAECCSILIVLCVQDTQDTLQAVWRHLQQQTHDQQQQQPGTTQQQQQSTDCLSVAREHAVQQALQQLSVVLAGELHLGLQPVQQQHWLDQAGAAAAADEAGVDDEDLALAAYLDAMLQQVCV